MKTTAITSVLARTLFWASRVNANVFDMPPGLTSLEMVPVGNPGNAPDTR